MKKTLNFTRCKPEEVNRKWRNRRSFWDSDDLSDHYDDVPNIIKILKTEFPKSTVFHHGSTFHGMSVIRIGFRTDADEAYFIWRVQNLNFFPNQPDLLFELNPMNVNVSWQQKYVPFTWTMNYIQKEIISSFNIYPYIPS